MRGTPFEDGPEMVTQCSIPYNNSQVYKFKLEQSGTYWWHSHVHWQYSEGMWGPLIIHNIPEVYADDYDDEILILLSDWYHTSGYVNTEWFLSKASQGNEPIPFSLLLNGHGKYPCGPTQGLCDLEQQKPPVFTVQKGKRYRIRVINTSAITAFTFSIEKHSLTVIEVDGVDTVKATFDKGVPIAPAQRYSFIVHMNGSDGSWYCIKAKADLEMFAFDDPNINPNPESLIPTVTAFLRYESDGSRANKSEEFVEKYGKCDDSDEEEMDGFPGQNMLRPYDLIPAKESFDQEIVLNVEPVEDDCGVNYLTFNNIIYRLSDEPVLMMVLRNQTIPNDANPLTVGFEKVVQIIINNRDTGSHPFHLHGHTFWVLGVGAKNATDYDAARDEQNLTLVGVRRDTVQVEANSWAVIRFFSDNPGVWYLHCHINWHLQSGLAALVIEAPEKIRENIVIPDEAVRICKAAGISV